MDDSYNAWLMLIPTIYRCFSKSTRFQAVEKSLLAALRKQTGYSFANCKKALELNGNNLEKAQEWLQQQAQSMGWSKAMKLEGRQTRQGLIGLLLNNNCASLVEMNCETDFVARNQHFKDMLEMAAVSCFNYTTQQTHQDKIQKIHLDSSKLRELVASDGKSLGDHLALMIGNVGENANLKRALCMQVDNSLKLYGYVHPAPVEGTPFMYGKYGALVALKELGDVNSSTIGKNVCQHIIGMNPKKIGNKDVDKPAENKDDETCLIYQEYLSNPDYLVHEILEQSQVKVVDFVRYECGEQINEIGKEVNPENIHTCQ